MKAVLIKLVLLFVVSAAVTSCGARDGTGSYETPGYTPPAKTGCVKTDTGLKCRSF